MDQPLKLVKRLKDKNCRINYNYDKQLRDRHEDVKYDIKNIKCGGGVKNVELSECVWN